VWGKSKGVSAIYPWVRFPCLVSYDFGFFLFGGARNELPQASTLTFTQEKAKKLWVKAFLRIDNNIIIHLDLLFSGSWSHLFFIENVQCDLADC